MTDSQKNLASRLFRAIADCISNSENENYINLREEDDTDFFYVLGAVVPTMIYGELVSDEINYLDFNHMMNSLIVQNGFIVEKD